MSNFNIKDFKPRVGGTKQGFFCPQYPEKYQGDLQNIIYRSSYELAFLRFCDTNDKILKYSSEPVGIPYFHPVKKRINNYYVDFWVELEDDNGESAKWIIEVKPMKYLKQPQAPKNGTYKAMLRYKKDVERFLENQSKFDAAKNWAKENDMKFGIVTEGFVFNNA